MVVSACPFIINSSVFIASFQAWINYCCREGYHRQLQTVCLDSLKKYGNDPALVFWKAFGMLMEGKQYCLFLNVSFSCPHRVVMGKS